MKKIYITLSLIFISGIVFSQDIAVKKADQLFGSYQYVEAIKSYLEIIKNKQGNQNVYRNLADSYYNIYNTTEAVKWYEKVVEKNADAETYFRYSQALKSIGNYAEANEKMKKFATLIPNDVRAKEFMQNQNYKLTLDNTKALFSIEKTTISEPKSNDFAAILTATNEVYFVSNRNSKKIDKWSNEPYIDIFKTIRNPDGSFSKSEEVTELNSMYHDGPVTISADGNTMFFARDGHSTNLYEKDKKNNAKIGQLGIYKAQKNNGKWEIKEGLPINNTSYSVSHPSLSKDGKTLFFSSNMFGGMGESDIWKIAITENGYGEPINLGDKINTASREVFPFITDKDELYFASTGWSGFGGLDIFKVENNSQVINLGKPVNTEKDDFSFSLNTELNKGYFSSNRNGNDAIFEATPICGIDLMVSVTDAKTGKNIENAKVTILDENNTLLYSTVTNTFGKCNQLLTCDELYSIQITASNYENVAFPISKSDSNQIELPVKLTPNEVVITDKEILLGDVYFEFNKFNITPVGAAQLDKLVTVLNANPAMIISVKSHTDSKGNLTYNLKLSEQRAQATVQYIISKGINKERVFGKGFGFTEPKIACNTNCTEEEDAINRRSEFIILKK
jgi:outer membrane protein OmpA-like peptidoglycan-associated protein/tetratricopeptide (TPR) repeat protein